MKIFIPLIPQLHWRLFTGNSCGVAHPGNGASLYLNNLEIYFVNFTNILQENL
jgi:hypothetical protein